MSDSNGSMAEWAERLRQAARKAVSEDDIRGIMQGLVERAKKGDLGAVKLLMAWLEPKQSSPEPASPAQQIKAQTVNIRLGGKRKGRGKLLVDPEQLQIENGKGGDQ